MMKNGEFSTKSPRGDIVRLNKKIFKARPGLTLIELIVVLSVIVIVAAGISFIPSERRLVTAAALTIQADIRYMQRIALAEGRRTQLTFNQANNSYILEKWDGGGFKTVKVEKLDPVIKSLYTNAPGASVCFTERGTTGDACTITLSSDGYAAALTVNVGAGRVKIIEITKKTGR